MHGEAASADLDGVKLAHENIRLIVSGYARDDIFNQDETGMFWWQLPSPTLATGNRAGRKKDKQRVTLSLTCNASGSDKHERFVICKTKRPRAFPKNFQPERDWGIRYRFNKKAWMTPNEFSSWALDWDTKWRAYAHSLHQ